MKKLKIGDVFTINTSNGKAYIQYVYKNKSMGSLIKALPGKYSQDILECELKTLVSQEELFLVFFPLNIAYKKGIIHKVGNFEIHEFSFPKFMRTKHMIRNEFLGWHIVNTETWERELVKTLTKEQKKLSPWGIWNDTLLIERLSQGWIPENENIT